MDKFYKAYNQLCATALVDEKVYQNFRRDPVCVTVVDGCWESIGRDCVHILQDAYPYLFERLYINDTIGNPVTFYYDEIGMKLSPTTLRFGKTAVDITTFFDCNGKDIVEIGVGYGSLCKVIHDLSKPKSYTLIDYPEVQNLSKKYLKTFGITPLLRDMNSLELKHYDLVISNFAFSEMGKAWQSLYLNSIIDYVKQGYMVCNIVSPQYIDQLLGKENVIIIPENPLTGTGNFIYIWNDGK